MTFLSLGLGQCLFITNDAIMTFHFGLFRAYLCTATVPQESVNFIIFQENLLQAYPTWSPSAILDTIDPRKTEEYTPDLVRRPEGLALAVRFMLEWDPRHSCCRIECDHLCPPPLSKVGGTCPPCPPPRQMCPPPHTHTHFVTFLRRCPAITQKRTLI